MRNSLRIIFFTIFLVILSNSNSNALSITEYLEQVKGQNLSYTAANQQAESAELLKKKADLITAINLFGSAKTSFNQQSQAAQVLRYTELYNQNYQVGLSQTSTFGLTSSLYYSINKYTYKNFNTSNFPNPSLASSNFQTNPAIALSLPLWQNRLGSSTKASKDALLYENEANKFSAKSISLGALVEAEKSYWYLAATKKIVEIQKLTLDQSQKILQYVTKRHKMNLGEKADILQAQALVEQKVLELKQAQNNEKIAARNFNRQRYIDSDQVEETIEDISDKELGNIIVTNARNGNRFDIKSAEAEMKTAVANAKIEEENNKPSLSLSGSYAFKGVEGGTTTALSRSLDAKGMEGAIGLSFSMPINIGLSSAVKRGAIKSASYAKSDYKRKLFDQENDWSNLMQNLENYKENLALSKKIENAQKAKLENERKLLKQGRTTTYQILLFEQEYSKSRITTAETAYQLLSLIADKKLYDGESAY